VDDDPQRLLDRWLLDESAVVVAEIRRPSGSGKPVPALCVPLPIRPVGDTGRVGVRRRSGAVIAVDTLAAVVALMDSNGHREVAAAHATAVEDLLVHDGGLIRHQALLSCSVPDAADSGLRAGPGVCSDSP
jgi:hypothetical protein